MSPDELERALSTLGVPQGASPRSVKRRYKAFVRQWHPDRFTGDPHGIEETTLRMRAINSAYDTILTADRSSLNGPQETASRSTSAGAWSQEQIEEVIQSIRSANDSARVEFTPSRVATAVLAVGYALTAYVMAGPSEAVGVALLLSLFPLPCIWFPDILGKGVNDRITRESPAAIVWLFGGALLLLPVVIGLVQWAHRQ
jgi:hypothetical protein